MREGWTKATVGEICEFRYGRALTAQNRSGVGWPVYGSNGIVGAHDAAITKGPAIVIGRKGSYGEVHYSTMPAWPIDTTYFVDETCTSCDIKWLAYRLQALGLTRLNRAAAVPGLNREDAYRLPLLVPPPAEQQRIALVLDTVDDLSVKRRRSIELLHDLVGASFHALSDDPKSSDWPVRALGDVARLFSGGTLPPGEPYNGQARGAFLMKVSDMNYPGNEAAITSCALWANNGGSRAATCPAGSVVIPKRGGAIGTNKKRLTTRTTVLDPNLMAISPRVEYLTPEYLHTWFEQFDLSSITSGSSVPQLNKKDLGPLSIVVPPLSVQRAFHRVHAAIARHQTALKAHLSNLEALFASLQHRAFNDEL